MVSLSSRQSVLLLLHGLSYCAIKVVASWTGPVDHRCFYTGQDQCVQGNTEMRTMQEGRRLLNVGNVESSLSAAAAAAAVTAATEMRHIAWSLHESCISHLSDKPNWHPDTDSHRSESINRCSYLDSFFLRSCDLQVYSSGKVEGWPIPERGHRANVWVSEGDSQRRPLRNEQR